MLKIQGQRLDPTTDSPDARPLPRRKAPHRAPFLLGHLPKRWDWDDDLGRFLPQLTTLTFMSGVQGTIAGRAGPDGRPRMNTAASRAHFTGKGGTLIDPSDSRLGKYRGYQQRVENDAGADVNYTIFESYDLIGDDVWWDHNAEEYREFCLLLLDTEILTAIHPRVRQRRMEIQWRAVEDLRKRFGRNPAHDGLKTQLEVAEATHRAMRDKIPTADAVALIRAEARAALQVEDAAEVDATPALTLSPIEQELAEARAYLAAFKETHADVYKAIIGRRRPGLANIERIREYVGAIERAIEPVDPNPNATDGSPEA